MDNLDEDQKMDIVEKLIDLEKFPKIKIDEIILDFDEYYLLENIKITE